MLLLTQWFDPEPTFKGTAFARALREAGHQVEVLTGFPNYPGGKIYSGHRQRLFQVEMVDGIRTIRVPLYPSHDSSGVRRALGYLSFAVSASVVGACLMRRPDVIYAYHPPLTTGLAAVWLSRVRRAPFVYDIQDLWPDTLRSTGMLKSEKISRLVGRFCDAVYERASRIVVLSPGFKSALISRGVPEHKLEVIYNWCDEARLSVAASAGHDAPENDASFEFVFAGTMGRAQDLGNVLNAASILQAEAPGARISLVGDGIEEITLKDTASRLGLTNVRFVGRVPMSQVGGILQRADALLVHLADDPLFTITIPGKTQAYLASGRPMLMAAEGDAAELVERSGGGVTCRPGDPRALADAALDLMSRSAQDLRVMGERGKAFYESELALRVGAARFVRVFEQAAGRQSSRVAQP